MLQVLEKPIQGDVALVYADRADALGNLWYRQDGAATSTR